MSKTLKWLLIIIGGLTVIGIVGFQFMKYQTKQHSPEETITYTKGNLDLEVYYNRPYKKDRAIFGVLVPYNKTWRTGANEQTTFSTKTPLLVDGSKLDAGTYSLFTVPKENSWEVIFNSKEYSWGARISDGQPPREPEFDELIVEVPVNTNFKPVEQFTISFEETNNLTLLLFAWDDVVVSVPLKAL